MVYVPLTRASGVLTVCGRETSKSPPFFDRALARLTHIRSAYVQDGWKQPMGFVVKSAFWLGLVYSAMPFNSGSPAALAPMATLKSPAAGSALGGFASAAIGGLGPNRADWKSAAEAAAALCSPDCFRASPAGLADAAPPIDPAGPPRRAFREKSGRGGAVRPLLANHIRSPDGQT